MDHDEQNNARGNRQDGHVRKPPENGLESPPEVSWPWGNSYERTGLR
jgi:hypothetical protein